MFLLDVMNATNATLVPYDVNTVTDPPTVRPDYSRQIASHLKVAQRPLSPIRPRYFFNGDTSKSPNGLTLDTSRLSESAPVLGVNVVRFLDSPSNVTISPIVVLTISFQLDAQKPKLLVVVQENWNIRLERGKYAHRQMNRHKAAVPPTLLPESN